MILQESVIPHHDFFATQFLVPFKYVGRHTIKIATGVTDQLGVEWETGPNYNIYIDVQEGHAKKR